MEEKQSTLSLAEHLGPALLVSSSAPALVFLISTGMCLSPAIPRGHSFPRRHSSPWWELTGTGAHSCIWRLAPNPSPDHPLHTAPPQPRGMAEVLTHCAGPGVIPGPKHTPTLTPRLPQPEEAGSQRQPPHPHPSHP